MNRIIFKSHDANNTGHCGHNHLSVDTAIDCVLSRPGQDKRVVKLCEEEGSVLLDQPWSAVQLEQLASGLRERCAGPALTQRLVDRAWEAE